jgi:pimeloyl-ACP methyl ester carboxylesterase
VHTRRIEVGQVELSIASPGDDGPGGDGPGDDGPGGDGRDDDGTGPGGRRGGQPLLLLHGFTGAKEDFSQYCDRLAESGWHAVAPDQRGHGESSKPGSDSDYSIGILATDALSLADTLGWDRFVLLGHSMGGYIAQEIAFEAPERLKGLILMDTGHVGPRLDRALVEAAVAVVRTRGIETLAEMLVGRESPLDTPAHRRLIAEDPGYAEFDGRKLRATSPHLYAALATELPNAPDSLERLADLPEDLPVLVVVGEQDTPFLEDSRRMAGAIPRARLAVIPDAGHSPQFENPEGWYEAVSGFLAEIS